MIRQFTATAYTVHENKVLLIHHKKMGVWLPPGGHVDPNELPTQTAIRETKEETGYEIEIISPHQILEFDFPNASSLPLPFQSSLEKIPANAKQEAHEHIDLIYLGKLVGGAMLVKKDEVLGVKWFSLQELLELDKSLIFPDVILSAKYLLNP